MIYEISKELGAKLAAAEVPAPVSYGPERASTTAFNRTRIVVERDRKGGDECLPPVSATKAPNASSRSAAPMVGMRRIGCVCRVYAQSTVDGARVQEHERVGDLLMDQVMVALRAIASERKTTLQMSSARLLSAEELEMAKLESWPGVVYELRFSVDRGVYDRKWSLATLEELATTDGLVTSTTQATLQGGTAPAVVACGTP